MRERLEGLSRGRVDAVFHAAAVSDFRFGKVWLRSAGGELSEIKSGKISTREGTLLAELVPTAKIIAGLRGWFPRTRLFGWKFEADGGRANAMLAAQKQLADCATDFCVANGPAYGRGFGLIGPDSQKHFARAEKLFAALEKSIR